VPPKAHARLGASGAKRWSECPGSIALGEGLPEVTSVYAEEGDLAHDLGETCLKTGKNPEDFVGEIVNDEVITEDMAFHVAAYVDHCRKYMVDGWEWWIERQVSLAPLNPPEDMFGTSDFIAYHAATQRLKVGDLKYGQGVVVEVANNVQTMYYALGAALELAHLPIKDVELTIVQPRVSHPDGIVRTVFVSHLDLIEFAGWLMAAARRALEPHAPLNPGEWCRFCPASGACPAQHEHAMAVAQMDFAIENSTPPTLATIPMETLAEWLPKFDILEAWMKAGRQRIRDALLRGEDVPGWKLVATRASRKWSDPEEAQQLLGGMKGLTESDIYEPRQLKSVPQIEKAMGKKAFRESPLVQIVTKSSSGVKLAPATDPAPAVSVTSGAEFLALPAGNSNESERSGDN
jgi:hypothetical protein